MNKPISSNDVFKPDLWNQSFAGKLDDSPSNLFISLVSASRKQLHSPVCLSGLTSLYQSCSTKNLKVKETSQEVSIAQNVLLNMMEGLKLAVAGVQKTSDLSTVDLETFSSAILQINTLYKNGKLDEARRLFSSISPLILSGKMQVQPFFELKIQTPHYHQTVCDWVTSLAMLLRESGGPNLSKSALS
jgi:hypothetical protein